MAVSYAADPRHDGPRQQVDRAATRRASAATRSPRSRPCGEVLDNRYNHGHYYPRSGAVVRALPGGYRPYYYRGSHYYFSGGIWYAPGPYGFIVTRPPSGLFLTVLPPFYTTVWLGGVPYYYADNVYYQWQPSANGYAVVDPPAGADQPGGPPAGAPGRRFLHLPEERADAGAAGGGSVRMPRLVEEPDRLRSDAAGRRRARPTRLVRAANSINAQ